MIIKNQIKSVLKQNNIFDKDGKLIPSTVIQDEYNKIKYFLLNKYQSNDIVGLYLSKDYKYFITLLACMEIGLTYIPLKKEWPDERIQQIQNISNCKLVSSEEIESALNTILVSTEIDSFSISPKKPLYIMFTSGTTGAPKGVIIRRESYENFILWIDKYFDEITSNDRLLFTTDFSFDFSLLDIGIYLAKGVNFYISDFSNDIIQLLVELEKFQISIHATVPYNYTMMISSNMVERADLSKLKFLILGGSRFPINLVNELKNKFATTSVYNLYGPTECTVFVTAKKIDYSNLNSNNNNVSIGKPIMNCNIEIIDDELCISGIQVMDGYLNNAEKTAESMFIKENKVMYKTGDLTFKDETGDYFIVGRKDDTVKVSGYRVNLLDIDSYIHKLEYIKDSATVLIDTENTDNSYLITYLLLKEHKEIKEIKEDLKKMLLSYQIAKKIIILDSFPLNNSGKVDRNALVERIKDV